MLESIHDDGIKLKFLKFEVIKKERENKHAQTALIYAYS